MRAFLHWSAGRPAITRADPIRCQFLNVGTAWNLPIRELAGPGAEAVGLRAARSLGHEQKPDGTRKKTTPTSAAGRPSGWKAASPGPKACARHRPGLCPQVATTGHRRR